MKARIITLGLALGMLTSFSAHALADNDLQASDPQLRRLLQPSERELEQERQGQVYIYDSLENRQIDRALDQQFNRVGSMMFVRTRVQTKDGEEEVLEDGCD